MKEAYEDHNTQISKSENIKRLGRKINQHQEKKQHKTHTKKQLTTKTLFAIPTVEVYPMLCTSLERRVRFFF